MRKGRTAEDSLVAGALAPSARPTVRERRTVDLDALTDHLGYHLRRAQVAVFQDFIRSLATVDLRPAQYSVLMVIGANPGLSQAELAEALAIERARLVHMLDRLQARGIVQRLASATDRRTHALHLTREGQKLLKRARTLAIKHEARLAEKIGGDTWETLRRLLPAFTAAR